MLKFNLQAPKYHIHVIGAGGTGGYLIEYLSRLLSATSTSLHVYDGDMVESKNLERQNFSEGDLNGFKAEAIVSRVKEQLPYSKMEITAHNTYVTTEEDISVDMLLELGENQDEQLMIVLAVDNVATRRLINSYISLFQELDMQVLFFDSGNDMFSGQCVVYSSEPVTLELPFEKPRKVMLPTMLEIFPDIDVLDENPGATQNCADNSQSEPQAMMANVINATTLANSIYQVMTTGTLAANLWQTSLASGQTRISLSGKAGESL